MPDLQHLELIQFHHESLDSELMACVAHDDDMPSWAVNFCLFSLGGIGPDFASPSGAQTRSYPSANQEGESVGPATWTYHQVQGAKHALVCSGLNLGTAFGPPLSVENDDGRGIVALFVAQVIKWEWLPSLRGRGVESDLTLFTMEVTAIQAAFRARYTTLQNLRSVSTWEAIAALCGVITDSYRTIVQRQLLATLPWTLQCWTDRGLAHDHLVFNMFRHPSFNLFGMFLVPRDVRWGCLISGCEIIDKILRQDCCPNIQLLDAILKETMNDPVPVIRPRSEDPPEMLRLDVLTKMTRSSFPDGILPYGLRDDSEGGFQISATEEDGKKYAGHANKDQTLALKTNREFSGQSATKPFHWRHHSLPTRMSQIYRSTFAAGRRIHL